MAEANELRDRVISTYKDMFDDTPLFIRLDDIQEEANELVAFTDTDNLKEEASDLLCTVLALAAEQEWSIDELVQMNLDKLAERKATGHYERTGEARK